jgi:hypothetical protein
MPFTIRVRHPRVPFVSRAPLALRALEKQGVF